MGPRGICYQYRTTNSLGVKRAIVIAGTVLFRRFCPIATTPRLGPAVLEVSEYLGHDGDAIGGNLCGLIEDLAGWLSIIPQYC